MEVELKVPAAGESITEIQVEEWLKEIPLKNLRD